MSSADERSATSDLSASERALSPLHSPAIHPNSLDGYATDEAYESASQLTDLSPPRLSVSHKPDRLSPASDRINLKTQQVSEHINALRGHFREFSDALIRQDGRFAQLRRQNGHCRQLLSTFENFLESFEETEATVYCGNWFAQLILLKEQLNDLDTDTELLISRLNDKMEHLFDFFVQEKSQLLNRTQTLANLEHLAEQLQFINTRISNAQIELDDINDYIEVQVREQRDQIPQFVEVMSAIVRSVEATMVCNDIANFDCFAGQHFLLEFSLTLNRIQII